MRASRGLSALSAARDSGSRRRSSSCPSRRGGSCVSGWARWWSDSKQRRGKPSGPSRSARRWTRRARATLAALGDGAARDARRGDFFLFPSQDSGESEEKRTNESNESNFWRDTLLPRDETVVAAFRERRGAALAAAGAEKINNDAELALVLRMAREVRTAASTRAFADALGDATARAWDRFAADALDALFPHRGGGHEDTSRDAADAVPVAKLVPAVSNLAGQTLADPRGVFGAVASCPKVQELAREMW